MMNATNVIWKIERLEKVAIHEEVWWELLRPLVALYASVLAERATHHLINR
ncbi:hypothetical protein N779_07525 [Vibrio coralliilyticus OCN008]|nr:hypothetical protein N779_07525 [Vibrio coralliilyticus OCN008]